ncbi:MAG: GDSL family lipase [Planctomycetota bacterium]|nr:GDSL family lipase [Planctomycetota bacterium]
MKIWIAAALCTLVLLNTSLRAEDAAALPVTVAAGDPNIQYMGRWDFKDRNAPRCNWPGCTVKAKFTGKAINAKITFNGGDHFEVVVDGKTLPVIKPQKGAAVVSLASGLSDGEHVLELCKRTETYVGKPQFHGFQLEAGKRLLPLPAPTRGIEIVGDSISCGYGNEGKSQHEHFANDTENNYQTYGYIAAREVKAAYSCIAFSGRKMWPDNTVPEIYDQIVVGEAANKWDFKLFTPDVVLINLATNDFRLAKDGAPEEKGWTDAYKAFIARVRQNYPKAHIYCAAGSMMSGNALNTLRGYLQSIVKSCNDAGDAKVHFLEFDVQQMSDGLGSDWHPSVKTHQKMAAKFVAAMKKDLGW